MNRIAAEHFDLTPTMRAHVERELFALEDLLPGSASIDVFLSESSPRRFRALCKVRVWGKDMVARFEHPNLYHAIDMVHDRLTRQITEDKHEWIHSRRKTGARAGTMSELLPRPASVG